MHSRRTDRFRRSVHWLFPAALLALTPKCLLCLIAYAGLGSALGLGPEMCGASSGSPASWTSSLAWLGVAGGVGGLGLLATCPCVRPELTGKSKDQVGTGGRPS